MESYFVHVCDGRTFKLRRRFIDVDKAKTRAIDIAKDLAQEEGWDEYWVVITDQNGAEIARMPVTKMRH